MPGWMDGLIFLKNLMNFWGNRRMDVLKMQWNHLIRVSLTIWLQIMSVVISH